MKILIVVGARPQFIKYAPLQKVFENYTKENDEFNYKLIHTGQHYDYEMSKVFFDQMGLPEPDYFLEVGSANHGKQTALILSRCEEIYVKENPDIVIVFGDTNSTLGAALAASKLHIKVAHIEAGLRSFNKYMPEEQNRILTDHISSFLFCPSKKAINNLEQEGFKAVHKDLVQIEEIRNIVEKFDVNIPLVINTGDIMFDSVQLILDGLGESHDILKKHQLEPKKYYLLTIHRAENTDNMDKFRELVQFINDMTEGEKVLFPVHPRTSKILNQQNIVFHNGVRIIDPVGYIELLTLIKNSKTVLTDSGGMQKEAFWLRTPCITLREETEWTETVESGWNILYKNYKGNHLVPTSKIQPYGDGNCAKRILEILKTQMK